MLLELLDPQPGQNKITGYPLAAARVRLDHFERADAEPIVLINSVSTRELRVVSYWTDAENRCNWRPLGITEQEVREVLAELGLVVVILEKTDVFEDELYYFYIHEPEEVLLRYGWWRVTISNDVDCED